jgi:GTP pyrophosphokinase
MQALTGMPDTNITPPERRTAVHEPPPALSPAPDEELTARARTFVRDRVRPGSTSDASARAAADQGLAVSVMIEELGADAALVAATALQPLAAHQLVSTAAIAGAFGAEVGDLVRALQKMGTLTLPERWNEDAGLDAQQAEALRRMLVAIVEDVRLVLVRLAEQLYRLRSLKKASGEEQRRCARETRAVYAPLASRLGIWQLKWELEDLAFRYLEPDTYKQIAQWLQERRTVREAYIARVTNQLRDALQVAGIGAEVAGRPKHMYSIWRKMLRKGVDFEHIFDVRAVRVIVATPAECYAALGIVHGMWPYIPGEFDDYIATPKDNDYQSLHTAVIGPEHRTLEIQIRTREMHRHAELGVAAHWAYKEGRQDVEASRERLAWLRQLLEPAEDEETERDFLDRIRSEVLEDRVYVLTPHGDVVDLPQGATPLDFAYHVHTELGHRCRGARVNGRMVSLTYKLQNGEQVEIIAAKRGEPSRDWLIPQLGYLVSSRARGKVRHWFRRELQEHNIEQGRLMLERELQRLGTGVPHVNDLAHELRMHSATDLYAAIGSGDITLSDVAAAVQKLSTPPAPIEPPVPVRRREVRGTGRTAVDVDGVGDLLTSFAQCCKPVPPDAVAGYITQGRGVSIHRRDCANFVRLAERQHERVLEVSWRRGIERSFPADLRIEAHDRRGLVKDVSTLLAAEHINILAMETRTDRLTQSALITLTIEVEGLTGLSRVLHRLASLANVTSVRRVT